MMINCAVIDDEPLARECIVNYINEVDFLSLAGQGNNPIELDKLLDSTTIDLVFLDIQMPRINGIDYLKMNKALPMVIFTTAYPSYALEGYQLDVLDYLLKPITFDRFFKAAVKAKEFFELTQQNGQSGVVDERDYFFVKCSAKYEKIYLDEILFIQAMQNYISIQTTSGKYMPLMNMKTVEDNLRDKGFIRVHKSFIIPMQKIESLEKHEAVISGHRIPISRNYRKEVMEQVLGNKLW